MKILLTRLIQHCYEVGKLHYSARRGVITLIPKKGRDILLIKNWCPITLLCDDHKIISKVISNRIKVELSTLISEDQTGFLKGRSISQNIRKTMDIQQITADRKIAAVLISVDFEKAFDRVEYNSLLAAFQFFDFPEYIINWIRILFTDIWLTTINNGYTSPAFQPTRGLFQGNPIGLYGFGTLIELLAIKL